MNLIKIAKKEFYKMPSKAIV
ncbi:hypothetical protein CNEO2_680025 [Clostridium neonatale]|nr:hypothetical protein CNEO2_680025 [Clostridium neonatale]